MSAASPARPTPAAVRPPELALTCKGCGRSVLLLVQGSADCLRCGRRMRAPRSA